jgi:hypothetical protein
MTGNGNHETLLKLTWKIREMTLGKFYFLAGFSHVKKLCGGAFFRLPPQSPPPGCHLSYNTEAAAVGEDDQCLYHSCRGDEL